ncbi:ribonuclease H-like domain-containing protein [Tanacetum coccineum]
MKGILRQFSIARTPQQNGVAERRNRTLIEAARTMLADSKLPTTFWAEAVNTACYVQNRVLVNHLGKFDGEADEGFFIGYSLNSKAFRVFNSRTRIVEENLHIKFSESTPNVVGSTQSNGFAGTKASDNAGQARKETEPVKDYILLPLWTTDPLFSQNPKSSHDDGSKPSSDDEKKVDKDPRKESKCNEQGEGVRVKEDSAKAPVNEVVRRWRGMACARGWVLRVRARWCVTEFGDRGSARSCESKWFTTQFHFFYFFLPFDPNISFGNDSIFDFSRDDEDDGAVADMNNLDTTIQVSHIPTTRIHKDHPLDQNPKRNKKDERGIVIRNKARLVAQGYTQEEGIDYDENLCFYVDDIIFGSTKKELCNAFEKLMHEKFQMSSMGELTFFLGLQVQQKKDGIFISQDKYVGEILKKFRFTEVKTASTPIETQKPLFKDKDGKEVDVHMYRYQGYLKVSHLMLLKGLMVIVNRGRKRIEPKISGGGPLFWSTVKVKTINGEAQLHALVDGKKIIITESSVRRDLKLEDEEGIDCLPNSTIFEQLTLMGYEKISQKLTFYKPFFSPQWKFLIHTILQCLSPKTTAWNEFSSTMASAIICLATNQKFNFSKFIFEDEARPKGSLGDSLVRVCHYCFLAKAGRTVVPETRRINLLELGFESKSKHSNESRSQENEIDSLKRRVKKLEKKISSRTHKLKRLYKVGLIARVESFGDEEYLGEDASKQVRSINAIDADEDITLVNVQDDTDNEMFDVNVLNGEKVFVVGQNEKVVEEVVDAA